MIHSEFRYDYFKYLLLGKLVPWVGYQFQDNLVLHTVASCAAGTVATSLSPSPLFEFRSSCPPAVCAPADVIRSRVMAHVSTHATLLDMLLNIIVQSGNEGVFQILNQSLRREGPRFLFKGWTPAFMRLGPNTVLLFVFMEVCSPAHIDSGVRTQPSSF